ncbi:DNA cytosine methyltransferase [Cytobacillus oceanisediminis]|uniref:DNA cytosine methyltransferase n=1 Tax=Cytobacillus oceanisediminis TaxID=665099 RepID=UPI001C21A72E|nr:DNA cytosine methyltransferase [Cytobacillus oceanisediminis]MBU8732554.1 DNA cytosine methyltransferase [Cytobacillus oceanisediminis]
MKNLFKNLIKKRKANKSNRGVYIQDKELLHTDFQVGSNFKYVIDVEKRKIIILPSDNKSHNTVSKRKLKNDVKPVIDIRNKEAISLFKDCQFMQVEIFGDEIIIEGFSSVEEGKTEKQSLNSVKKGQKITDIKQFLKVQKKSCIRLSSKDLQQAVGNIEVQTASITSFVQSDQPITSNVKYIQNALENLKIPLQVVSLFSGAGLFDFAFKEQGFDIVFALEKDSDIAKTYRYNLGDIVTADIREFDKSKIPFAPVIIGGSPCKGFSNANRKSKFLDNPNNLLVREYIECVKKVNPYIFVLENVPQILTAGEGQFFNEIKQALPEFKISSNVVSTAGYGDFQDRKRAIIIGSRLETINLPEPSLKPSQYKTVREAFKGITEQTPNQKDVSKPKKITLERMKHVKPGGNIFDIPEHLRPKGQHSDMYKRLELDKVSVTIVNPRKAMLLHPSENRILSIREACRLFSLPDSYVFKSSLSKMQESIANAVPVQFGKMIAKTIKNTILKFNIRNREIPAF